MSSRPAWRQAVEDWTTSPGVQRPAFWVLRRLAPVLQVGTVAIVSRYDDVAEVLADDARYLIAPINEARMRATTGDFILGMDDPARHDRERSVLAGAVRRDDLPRIETIVRGAVQRRLAPVREGNPVDLVGTVFRPSLVDLVRDYFGVPVTDADEFLYAMRIIFHDIFLNFSGDARVHEPAVRASARLDDHLRAVIRARRRDGPAPAAGSPDVLGRLLAAAPPAGWSDADIRRNLAGLLAGAVETVAKAAALVANQLLAHPDWMRTARSAVERNDAPGVTATLLEALRFHPHNPILLRSVAPGPATRNGRLGALPAGTTVYAATLSAMFDERWPQPGAFRTDRTPGQYLHFGGGRHACFGQHVVPTVLRAMLVPVIEAAPLRRVGRLRFAGPFPDLLRVRR
jgi:cytochrome P450